MESKRGSRFRPWRRTGWAGSLAFAGTVVISACGVTSAMAQSQSPLEQASLNPQQKSMAANVVAICPVLKGLGGASAPGDGGDLFLRCNGAIQLADPSNANFDSSGAASTLQLLAGEEVVGQQAIVDGIVQPQTRAIAARVSTISGRFRPSQLVDAQPRRREKRILLASAEPVQLVAEDSGVSLSLPSGLGAFLTGNYSFGDRDASSLEDGFDFNDYAVTGGVDYFVLDNVVVGFAGGYGVTDIDFDDNAGELDADAYNVAVYSLWNPLDQLGLSGFVSYGMIDYDSERNLNYTDPNGVVNRVASGDTDADQLEVSGNIYYDFTRDAWTFGPTLRASYLYTDVDGYTEDGAQGLDLTFDDYDADSFQTALGGEVSRTLSTSFGVVVFQARGEWIHEFLDDSETITVRYENEPAGTFPTIIVTTDDPDRDRALIGGGASVVLEGGISAFANFETVLFHEDVETYTATAGVRLEF